MSIRTLLDTFGELITAIMPCTLMSPDSVARFFPPKPGQFDLVVFDEASQIRVADAIGAMGRSRAVVVVGDSKQMPPTSFAQVGTDLDDAEEYQTDGIVTDEESILTECVQALLPRQWLSWHYRSQDESLIAFSNRHYYEGRLASFPAPVAGVAAGYGVSLVRVDGVWRPGTGKGSRTNRIEADRIVADICGRFVESPGEAPSIGVVTFNAQQRDLIENLLRDVEGEVGDRLLAALDAPDGLFVKNLENVQGDERDTILFSVAFSANERGRVPLNFGPLSRPGGERRLNVAITRARREVVLYASFDPEQLRAEETTQIGTKHLKAYLELAARGADGNGIDATRQPVIDRHRDAIAETLRAEGLTVSTDVGLSDFRIDLVIADPDDADRPLVAVLLDGEGWYSRRTVADRDALPIDVLVRLLGWPAVERVWLPEWLQQPDEAVARLQRVVEETKQRLEEEGFAEERATEEAAEPEPGPEPGMEPADSELSPELSPAVAAPTDTSGFAPLKSAPSIAPQHRKHPMLRPFREWAPRIVGDISVLDELALEPAKQRVRAVIDEVMAVEAPIHRDRLAKLVGGAFDLQRVAASRRRAILQVVPRHYRHDHDGFYWPADLDPQTWRVARYPVDDEARPIDEVSLAEIGNAMAVVAEQTGGIGADELKREALGLFGGKRMTAGIEERLDEALAAAWHAGRLVRDRNLVRFDAGR